jgi:glycerol-3-phosphate dehydrogenase (NAD(P)+)
MNEIGVAGAGAWGTALAIQAARAGNKVVLWARTGTGALAATREAPRLPGNRLPDLIRVTADLGDLPDLTIVAAPTQALRSVLTALPSGRDLLIVAKGIEAGSLLLPLEIVADVRPDARAAVLTGPNFAHEIAAGLPAAAVIAGTDKPMRDRALAALATPSFRLYGGDDPIGAQVGGAAKNVIAIAAGAVTGAGLGENARAALITRGLAELTRLTAALGGRAETVMGLSGLGDLLLTCTGPASRNFSLGLALGRGESLASILGSRGAVTEGVMTAPALLARAKGVDMPVCAAVAALLAEETTLRDAIAALLARPRRDE